MPALPVISNVFRCAVEILSNGLFHPVSVFHVRSHSAADAGDVLDQVTARLDDHLDMWSFLHSTSSFEAIKVTPLDGSTATVQGSLASTMGTGSGDSIPQACALIHIGTGQRGSRGRGRIYTGPVTEDLIHNGSLDSTLRGTVQTAWNDFATDLNAFGGPVEVEFGVASYVHSDFHPSVSITCQALGATQRRRMDKLR